MLHFCCFCIFTFCSWYFFLFKQLHHLSAKSITATTVTFTISHKDNHGRACDRPTLRQANWLVSIAELEQNMRNAEKYAREHSVSEQQRYAKYYNTHAKDKSFQTGEQAIVVEKDSTHKPRC